MGGGNRVIEIEEKVIGHGVSLSWNAVWQMGGWQSASPVLVEYLHLLQTQKLGYGVCTALLQRLQSSNDSLEASFPLLET